MRVTPLCLDSCTRSWRRAIRQPGQLWSSRSCIKIPLPRANTSIPKYGLDSIVPHCEDSKETKLDVTSYLFSKVLYPGNDVIVACTNTNLCTYFGI